MSQTVEKVGLPQKNIKIHITPINNDIYNPKLNGKGIIEKPSPFFAFHQNEPCRTFVLSAFILVKYPFLLSKSASVSKKSVYRKK